MMKHLICYQSLVSFFFLTLPWLQWPSSPFSNTPLWSLACIFWYLSHHQRARMLLCGWWNPVVACLLIAHMGISDLVGPQFWNPVVVFWTEASQRRTNSRNNALKLHNNVKRGICKGNGLPSSCPVFHGGFCVFLIIVISEDRRCLPVYVAWLSCVFATWVTCESRWSPQLQLLVVTQPGTGQSCLPVITEKHLTICSSYILWSSWLCLKYKNAACRNLQEGGRACVCACVVCLYVCPHLQNWHRDQIPLIQSGYWVISKNQLHLLTILNQPSLDCLSLFNCWFESFYRKHSFRFLQFEEQFVHQSHASNSCRHFKYFFADRVSF